MHRAKFEKSLKEKMPDQKIIDLCMQSYDIGTYQERNDCIQDCRDTKESFRVFRGNPLHNLSVDHCIERIRKRWEKR